MKPRRTPDSNTVFRLGQENEDHDLWAQRGTGAPELEESDPMAAAPFVRTVWELSPEERDAITAGGNVALVILGTGQPPCYLAVATDELGKGTAQEPSS